MKDLVIYEKDLELVVSEKTLGSLTTNAKQIRDLVANSLPRFDITNYSDDNIDQAKKDKALLNKASKMLNSKRLEIEKEFVKPFAEFKEIVNETVKLISDCSNKIDNVVKQNEEQSKEAKRQIILTYFTNKNFTIIPFSKIFKEEWLNKTVKDKAIFAEIDSTITRITEELSTIESLGEDLNALKTYYLDSLSLSNTIMYANKIRESRKQTEILNAKQEELKETTERATIIVNTNTIHDITNSQPILLTRAFKVTTSKENIIALSQFMNQRGISFEKLEI